MVVLFAINDSFTTKILSVQGRAKTGGGLNFSQPFTPPYGASLLSTSGPVSGPCFGNLYHNDTDPVDILIQAPGFWQKTRIQREILSLSECTGQW
jgi:hypothetical protein